MQLRKLPFNTHSKVNRDMLPEPSFESKDYESPKGFFEEKIARAIQPIRWGFNSYNAVDYSVAGKQY